MRVFCVLVPGGGGPPARRPRRELRSACRLEARAASCPFGVRAASCRLPSAELVFSCLSACWCPGAAARPLAVRAASFARRVVSKPALRAARLPSAALRAARSVCRSLSEGLVFSCLFACWCLGAAARPLAVRAASFARRVVSKPGQALPPPPGTRAKPFGSFGVLHSGSSVFSLVANGVVLLNGCNAPSQAYGFSFCPRLGRIVRRGEPATEQDTPTRHGLVIGSDAPRAVFAVSA